jgi:hypothetical protein
MSAADAICYCTLDRHHQLVAISTLAIGEPISGLDLVQVARYEQLMRARRPLPPIYLKRSKGELRVVDGHHRLRASECCGFTFVPAVTISP